MPLFRYVALNQRGKRIKGVIDADNLEAAKEKLRKLSVMTVQITAQKEKEVLSLSSDLLLAFTRDLAQLLHAGLPLYESLLTIEEKYRSHRVHPLFLDLCDRLKGGSSLSSALRRYPKTFDGIYLAMILAGEQSGSLERSLQQLSQLISRQSKLKKQLVASMAYPALLGVFCLIVIGSLLFFVIPSMQELFEGRALHPLTQTVLGVSVFVNTHLVALLVSFGIVVSGGVLFSKSSQGRQMIQKALLKLPFFKSLVVQTGLIRFCRACSLLLSGGVPLVEALALSRQVMRQALLQKVIEDAEKRVVEGAHLSDQFKSAPFIPPLVSRMLAIAEETGQMAPMMYNIAEIYDEELDRNLQQITGLLQPFLLLILGGIVGVVLLSILLPLTDVSSFLQ